jgi:site-specific recombinase XerD
MDLGYVSVENSKFYREYSPPEEDIYEAIEHNIAESSIDSGDIAASPAAHPQIVRVLERISIKGLSGQALVKEYLLSQHRNNCRPSTLRSSGGTLILFLSFLKDNGIEHLEATTREAFSAFIEHEQDRGMKPATVRLRLRTLNAFFRFFIEREVIHPDVLEHRMRIKVPDALPRAIDPEDVRGLLSVIKTPRDKAMIMVLLRTGMRIGELLNTTLQDLNLKEKRIEIFEAQKNRVGRVVYVSDDARVALKKWLKQRTSKGPYIFYGTEGRPLSYEASRSAFHKYLGKAGLDHKGYTLHCLRHTFASELLNAGMRLECLQQLLGHSTIEMTRRYARLTDNTRKEEYFRAMQVIEGGGVNGHYRCNYPLP